MQIIASIDPVTRIEGHMKVEVTIDTVNGVQQVVNARSVGTMFRGFEKILIGRDPRDAQHITERICGVCPVSHAMAAVMALDRAFGVTIPSNALLLRNLVMGANFIDSHILHFYLLAVPDFLDGPGKVPWQPTWPVDKRITGAQAQTLVAHYVQAVGMRRKAHEMGAVFGGRMPHPPAYLPGGFTAMPTAERIDKFFKYLQELLTFVIDVYIPDVEALASVYNDYGTIGRGPGNLLAFGCFDLDAGGVNRLLKRGHVINGSTTVAPVDVTLIAEHVSSSWYATSAPVNPASGKTDPVCPKTNAYSWLKAPRYQGKPYEVGALARMWVNGDYRRGISVMDRHRARAQETLKIAQAMVGWINQIKLGQPVYKSCSVPNSATAVGLTEAPRGALGHWFKISNRKLSSYQIITPTCWNCSPRDDKKLPGPLEIALIGTPVANIKQPIEVLRVIHSFDPCLDCAVHVAQPKADAKVFPMPHIHAATQASALEPACV